MNNKQFDELVRGKLGAINGEAATEDKVQHVMAHVHGQNKTFYKLNLKWVATVGIIFLFLPASVYLVKNSGKKEGQSISSPILSTNNENTGKREPYPAESGKMIEKAEKAGHVRVAKGKAGDAKVGMEKADLPHNVNNGLSASNHLISGKNESSVEKKKENISTKIKPSAVRSKQGVAEGSMLGIKKESYPKENVSLTSKMAVEKKDSNMKYQDSESTNQLATKSVSPVEEGGIMHTSSSSASSSVIKENEMAVTEQKSVLSSLTIMKNGPIHSETISSSYAMPTFTPLNPLVQSMMGSLRVGLNFMQGHEQKSMGVLAEYFVWKRLSISTGLQFNAGHQQRFHSEDAFEEHHGHHFSDIYDQQIPYGHHAEDISLRENHLDIPLYLQYYHPLYKSINLVAYGGPLFRVYNRHNGSYTVDGNTDAVAFGKSIAGGLVSSISAGIGIEKSVGRFHFMLAPGLNFTLEDSGRFRGDDHVNFTGQLRMMYRLR